MTTVARASNGNDGASESLEEELEYVSPFRDATAVQIAQRRRLARYPTTSATSGYTMVNPSDMGYKTLGDQQQRAKDIAFPVYLSNNEKRQALLLEKLRAKEAHLKYLRDSQVLTDLRPNEEKLESDETALSRDGDEAEDEDAEKESANAKSEDEGKDAVEVAPLVEAKHDAAAVDVGHAEVDEAVEEAVAPETTAEDKPEASLAVGEAAAPETTEGDEVEDEEAVAPETTEEEKPGGEETAAEVAAPESVVEDKSEVPEEDHTSDVLSPPIDPHLAPRVPIPEETEKAFKIPWFRSSSKSKGEYPVATPENPEEIVITAQEGHLNKAVYDKIQYESKVHYQWLTDFNKIEEEKYYNKKLDYSNKLKAVQLEIDEIHSQMDQLKKETSKTLDIFEAELTRKMLDSTQVHVNKKHKIFKETDTLRNQKSLQKDTVLIKSEELQKEIDDLNESKSGVQAEYIGWTNRLADLSAHIDAKVSKVLAITEQSKKTQSEIDKLKETKNQLILETENNNVQHEENKKVLEDVKNKAYLPQINEIDNQINDLLSKMALIKQEGANERIELSAITKRVEEERRAHEEKLMLEAEERKRKEEDLLNKQRLELEKVAEEQKLQHEEELQKLKVSYEELEAKLLEQETRHNELQDQEKAKTLEKEKEAEELKKQAQKLAVDSTKESAVESTKESAEEPAKISAVEFAKESAKAPEKIETAKETTSDTSKEPSKEQAVEKTKEPVEEPVSTTDSKTST